MVTVLTMRYCIRICGRVRAITTMRGLGFITSRMRSVACLQEAYTQNISRRGLHFLKNTIIC